MRDKTEAITICRRQMARWDMLLKAGKKVIFARAPFNASLDDTAFFRCRLQL